MKFSVKFHNNLEKQNTTCIVVGIFESRRLSLAAEQLDTISNGYIRSILHRGAVQGKICQTLLLHDVPNIRSKCILIIGCGKTSDMNIKQYKTVIDKTISTLNDTGIAEAICFLTDLNVHIKGYSTYWKVRHTVEVSHEALYRFHYLKSKKVAPLLSLRKLTLNIPTRREIIIGANAMHHSLAVVAGIKIAKDLSNMPPNICNATYLSLQAQQLSELYSNTMTTYSVGEKKMTELGMHAYLAVGRSSHNESLMSVIEYRGHKDKNARPIVFIGKGVTFDSGGISLKPAEGMGEMKYDMCGAASVCGIMKVVAELRLPLNIIGVMAGCENMPGGYAYRPGDVITTMSGQTVEILNTDAEGRLILCDTLTYVERFKPEIVIDIATLTGACVVALGHHHSGLLSNYNPLAKELMVAAEQSGDYVWRLPITEDYQKQLESNIADMKNIGGKYAGAITAACFLERFTRRYHWAHLDIAGTAWRSTTNKGATGRPVSLLSQFLINRSNLNEQIESTQ
ncbi:Cytosol aminopeptidase [Candidatus Erwinia haradaeae]|uniref:Probable cytosol aminopeptidase n=1 Tax=Candidatus Erwinia haradaeae TaxID=1922217 RepID=A0A451DDP8_9GAMM|nr:leucyl aminopeptidase [Candidatus Erwinia haradaeae]VFP84526.1 Cytosol aminopeptidase [Candidatus Erwinia haradaeae]